MNSMSRRYLLCQEYAGSPALRVPARRIIKPNKRALLFFLTTNIKIIDMAFPPWGVVF